VLNSGDDSRRPASVIDGGSGTVVGVAAASFGASDGGRGGRLPETLSPEAVVMEAGVFLGRSGLIVNFASVGGQLARDALHAPREFDNTTRSGLSVMLPARNPASM
jgi:hypothetical protein